MQKGRLPSGTASWRYLLLYSLHLLARLRLLPQPHVDPSRHLRRTASHLQMVGIWGRTSVALEKKPAVDIVGWVWR